MRSVLLTLHPLSLLPATCVSISGEHRCGIASKVESMFQLDSSAVESEILTLQNDTEIQSRATPSGTYYWNKDIPNSEDVA